jgi:hypothetical protein
MKTFLSILMIFTFFQAFAQTAPSKVIQIKMAVLAAPEDQQEEPRYMDMMPKGMSFCSVREPIRRSV